MKASSLQILPAFGRGERSPASLTVVTAGLLALAWIVSSWLLAAEYAKWRGRELISTRTVQAHNSAEAISLGIERSFLLLHGVPATVGQDETVMTALRASNSAQPPADDLARRRLWSQHARMQAVHEILTRTHANIPAFSVIWIMDARGNAISASNHADADSFVGTNYADREYFDEAMSGRFGRQYAIGRKTNIPGLYFSAPVYDHGRVIGAVAGKVDMSYLTPLLEQANAFISDKQGVVILARDRELEMRTLPNQTVELLPEQQRSSRYRRTTFTPLKIERWLDTRFPSLVRVDNDNVPYLFQQRPIPREEINVGVLQALPEIRSSERDQTGLFILLSSVGTLLVACFAGISLYLANTRHARLRLAERSQEMEQQNELLHMIARGASAAAVLDHIARFSQTRFRNGQCLIHLLTEDSRHLRLAAAPSIPAELYHRIDEFTLGSNDCPWPDENADISVVRCENGDETPLCSSLGRLLTGTGLVSMWSAAIRDPEQGLLGVLSLIMPLAPDPDDEQKGILLSCTRLAALGVTRERTEASLRQARDAAEAANRAKGDFLANMSHEVRTPMNGVLGMTELLLNTGLTAEQREHAETVHQSAMALLGVINDILDFSKIDAGKLDIEEIDFDLRNLLNEISNMFQLRAADKELEFICIVDPAVHSLLRGDPGRLRQILINLIGNAIKFTSVGEVSFGVELIREEKGTAHMRFAVSDTGIGIAPEKLGSLFSPFMQADSSTTREYGGTGLGLSIAKRLVELMGGQIGVDSRLNYGSTFHFALSLKLQAEGRQKTRKSSPSGLKGKRILIIDDNQTNRQLLSVWLSAWQCEILLADDGRTALDLVAQELASGRRIDAAIVDQQMPRMDGEHFAIAMRAEAATATIPLLLLTSVGVRGEAGRLSEIGFRAYLTKPVKSELLLRSLQSVLLGGNEMNSGLITRHTFQEHDRHAHLLLVEDNPVNQRLAEILLKKLGHQVDTADNGVEALAALAKTPYDLVFMDCRMPVMDGYETTRAIRQGQGQVLDRHIPIVAMTANAMAGDRELVLEAGMDDYLAKPINPQLLEEVLKRWLKPVAVVQDGNI